MTKTALPWLIAGGALVILLTALIVVVFAVMLTTMRNQSTVPEVRRPAGDDVPIGNNPRLALSDLVETNYTYDFGQVSPEEVQRASITIENKGTQPLEIKSVRSSCGCIMVLPGEDIVPPGGMTNLWVTYDPTHNNDAGKLITRQILIESNDPAAPVVEFTIRARVQR